MTSTLKKLPIAFMTHYPLIMERARRSFVEQLPKAYHLTQVRMRCMCLFQVTLASRRKVSMPATSEVCKPKVEPNFCFHLACSTINKRPRGQSYALLCEYEWLGLEFKGRQESISIFWAFSLAIYSYQIQNLVTVELNSCLVFACRTFKGCLKDSVNIPQLIIESNSNISPANIQSILIYKSFYFRLLRCCSFKEWCWRTNIRNKHIH